MGMKPNVVIGLIATASMLTTSTIRTTRAADNAEPTAVVASATAEPTTWKVSDRFQLDNQCVTIDGHDMVLFSGAFHYFRCPQPLWGDRFRKLKAAGFNTLETYVAWNYHEPSPPSSPDDYSKLNMTELNAWLDMAINTFGFNVILRPGPYICAEWDGGGYPQWLLTRRPADYKPKEWYRSDDPAYLAWCKHWFTAVAKVAVPYQITHRPAGSPGGILFWQIENEYNYSDQPATVKRNQLDFLAHASRDLGIDVPLITCMTSNALFRQDDYLRQNVIECRNTYPKFDMRGEAKDLDALDKYQPDRLRIVTELQGGWFAQVGGKLSEAQGYNATHLDHVTLFAWEHGFTGTNYYMGFGGTNFGDWAARGLTTTYDYDAPVREPGGETSRYFMAKGLGAFITAHGAQLARTSPETVQVQGDLPANVHVAVRRGNDGSRFLFVRTEDRKAGAKGTLSLTTGPSPVSIQTDYDLPPFGAKVMYLAPGATTGEWFPKPADPPQRPTNLPAAVSITDGLMQGDPGPSTWTPLPDGGSEEDAGIFNRGFVYYRATPPMLVSLALSYTLHKPDWAEFSQGGKALVPDAKASSVSVVSGVPVEAVYENYGRPNFGKELEQRSGILNPNFDGTDHLGTVQPKWEISDQIAGIVGQWWKPDADDSKWQHFTLGGDSVQATPATPLTWYRLKFSLPTTDPHAWVPWKAHLDVAGNGFLYLNDHALGRWWEVGPQRDFYLPECWLNVGPGSSNVLTLCLRPTKGVGVRSATVEPYADLAEVR